MTKGYVRFTNETDKQYAEEVTDATTIGANEVTFDQTDLTTPIVNPFIKSQMNIIGFKNVRV